VKETLPNRRYGTTYSAKILATQPVRVYVRVNDHASRIVEVFIDVELREGSPLVETARALARMTSRALRAGADVSKIVGDLVGTTGGPSGQVLDVEGIDYTTSIPDLVGQVLRLADERIKAAAYFKAENERIKAAKEAAAFLTKVPA
jgi:hypothetical protein